MDLGDADLQPMRVLGEGTYGRVFLCKARKSKKMVCVKRIIVQNPKVLMKMILEEVYIISQLKHPLVVQFIRSFVHAGTVNIVMEYMPHGTLRDLISRTHRSGILTSNLVHYFCDILMGLEYLHMRQVLHRDLKPENLLISAEDRIKIADFGMSAVNTPHKDDLNGYGTPRYMAPEVLRGEKFDFKSDIWAVGCILYELCIGQSPFMQASNLPELRYLIRELTRPTHTLNCRAVTVKYGPVWGRLCERMLAYEPQQRISLPNILCLDPIITIPYFRQYFDYKY